MRFLALIGVSGNIKYTKEVKTIIYYVLKEMGEKGLSSELLIDPNYLELAFGVFSWNIEIILRSLKTGNNYEAYWLCYSIIVLFNCKTLLLSPDRQDRKILSEAIEILMSSVFKSICPSLATGDSADFSKILAKIPEAEKQKKMETFQQQIGKILSMKYTQNNAGAKFSWVGLITQNLSAILTTEQREAEKFEHSNKLFASVSDVLSGKLFNKLDLITLDPTEDYERAFKLIIDCFNILSQTLEGKKFNSIDELLKAANMKAIPDLSKIRVIPQRDYVQMLFRMFFLVKCNSDHEEVISSVLEMILEVLNKMEIKPEHLDIFLNLVQLVTNYNYDKKTQKISKQSIEFSKKITILFTQFIPALIPSLKDKPLFTGNFIPSLLELQEILFQQYSKGIANKDILSNIIPKVTSTVTDIGLLPAQVTDLLLGLSQGNLKKCVGILTLIVPDKKKALMMEKFILQVGDMIDLKQITTGLKVDLSVASRKDQLDEELAKIKAGSSDPHLLFQIVDKTGDGNGNINVVEFQRLAGRMGVQLTQHRVLEIFSKVRGQKKQETEAELNENEFAKAIGYIQDKNIFTAMAQLGITGEQLAVILVALIILLLLLLVFIYLGILAFAIGGSFGAVINSLFPAAGGLGLGKQGGKDEEKIAPKNVEASVGDALEIVQSQQL